MVFAGLRVVVQPGGAPRIGHGSDSTLGRFTLSPLALLHDLYAGRQSPNPRGSGRALPGVGPLSRLELNGFGPSGMCEGQQGWGPRGCPTSRWHPPPRQGMVEQSLVGEGVLALQHFATRIGGRVDLPAATAFAIDAASVLDVVIGITVDAD
jgi:hypothetical protein